MEVERSKFSEFIIRLSVSENGKKIKLVSKEFY